MKNKTQRLLAIKSILLEKKISNQEELMQELETKGYQLTQATLSRDLKFLKVSKVVDTDKGYIYQIPESNSKRSSSSADKFPVTGFQTIEFSENLAVIKTMPGYASSIASRIDKENFFEILATIAGDDTILVIPREGVGKTDVINVLAMIMPEMNNNK